MVGHVALTGLSVLPFTQEKTKADTCVQTGPAWDFLANTGSLSWVYKKLRRVIPSHTEANKPLGKGEGWPHSFFF